MFLERHPKDAWNRLLYLRSLAPGSDILRPSDLALDASLSVDRSCGLDLNKLADTSLVDTFDKEAYLIPGE